MSASEPQARRGGWLVELLGGGAAGVGLVLVFLPAVTMVANVAWFDRNKTVGLPVLAILGIMILLGTLALVAMLFKRLKLADRQQPLALPPGSMRAAIALSLIVLFAIISITLYLSISDGGEPFRINGLREAERNALLTGSPSRVVSHYQECATTAVPCAVEDRRYAVVMRVAPSSESIDLAKQLLVLVGTLMTSVTSYYFATRAGAESSRALEAATRSGAGGGTANSTPGNTAAGPAAGAAAVSTAHVHDPDDADGCDVDVLDATPDDQLPPAAGGVAPAREGG